MKLSPRTTEVAMLAELGSRLEQARLRAGFSQLDLAERAGVAKRTVERFESGRPGSLENFIRLSRALGFIEQLDSVLPEATASPIEQIKQRRGKKRQRVSSTRKKSSPPSARKWIWGDEQ